jgi:hypothetical protein
MSDQKSDTESVRFRATLGQIDMMQLLREDIILEKEAFDGFRNGESKGAIKRLPVSFPVLGSSTSQIESFR